MILIFLQPNINILDSLLIKKEVKLNYTPSCRLDQDDLEEQYILDLLRTISNTEIRSASKPNDLRAETISTLDSRIVYQFSEEEQNIFEKHCRRYSLKPKFDKVADRQCAA